MEKLTYLLKTI